MITEQLEDYKQALVKMNASDDIELKKVFSQKILCKQVILMAYFGVC